MILWDAIYLAAAVADMKMTFLGEGHVITADPSDALNLIVIDLMIDFARVAGQNSAEIQDFTRVGLTSS